MKSMLIPFGFENGSVRSTPSIDIAVQQQIINYFMTNAGERVMQSGYGGNLQNIVFEIDNPLIWADYKLDALPEVNMHLSTGRVIDVAVLTHPNNPQMGGLEDGVATVSIRYATSMRGSTQMVLTVRTNLTEESSM